MAEIEVTCSKCGAGFTMELTRLKPADRQKIITGSRTFCPRCLKQWQQRNEERWLAHITTKYNLQHYHPQPIISRDKAKSWCGIKAKKRASKYVYNTDR